jgi:hypothetical protein
MSSLPAKKWKDYIRMVDLLSSIGNPTPTGNLPPLRRLSNNERLLYQYGVGEDVR